MEERAVPIQKIAEVLNMSVDEVEELCKNNKIPFIVIDPGTAWEAKRFYAKEVLKAVEPKKEEVEKAPDFPSEPEKPPQEKGAEKPESEKEPSKKEVEPNPLAEEKAKEEKKPAEEPEAEKESEKTSKKEAPKQTKPKTEDPL